MILILLLFTVIIFPFQTQLYFLGVSIKKYNKRFHTIFSTMWIMFVFFVIKSPNYWYWISTRNMLSNFCCWRFFYILCASIYFLVEDSMSALIIYYISLDFIYWLNSNSLSFSDGITNPQKSLFLHTFSWDLSLFSVLKEWR